MNSFTPLPKLCRIQVAKCSEESVNKKNIKYGFIQTNIKQARRG
jgi:hypothetical protein